IHGSAALGNTFSIGLLLLQLVIIGLVATGYKDDPEYRVSFNIPYISEYNSAVTLNCKCFERHCARN
ncbi:MAG: hypothetical protein CMQ06_05855, partial [Gammaproteobacteria bacterium]|nr:hypothetical protein [Gammaproteobacteria bacterium]